MMFIYTALQDDRLHDLAQIARETLGVNGDCWEVRNTILYIMYKIYIFPNYCMHTNLCKCSGDEFSLAKLFFMFL